MLNFNCFEQGDSQSDTGDKLTSNDIIAGYGMILGLKWFCIVVVNYQRQHYVLKYNSFDAVPCDIISRPCFVIQDYTLE